MERFLQQHRDRVSGVLSGFDSVLFRGTLRPISPEDVRLFRVIMLGEFLLQGFRNKDVRLHLLPEAESHALRRCKASGRVTRWVRLLRTHGLIRKISGTRYYRVTEKGHHVMTTALKLRQTDVSRLAA